MDTDSNSDDLRKRLVGALGSDDFVVECERIAEDLKSKTASIIPVRVILRFMEEFPTQNFGMPGPLVHFMEGFYGRGYEAELLSSIDRRPTSHTVWLLNRVINGTKDAVEKQMLIAAMKKAEHHILADVSCKRLTEHFLHRLNS